MTEIKAQKKRLIYLETGNPYCLCVGDNEKISKNDLHNNIESRVGSLHQFLLRNTNLINFDTSDHYISGDGYNEYGYNVFALFDLNINQNEDNSFEIIGCIDLLTAAGQDIWTINYEKSKQLYNNNYLKDGLDKKPKLGFYDWLFQMLKQKIDIDDIVDDALTMGINNWASYEETRKNIKLSEDSYKLLKPNYGD